MVSSKYGGRSAPGKVAIEGGRHGLDHRPSERPERPALRNAIASSTGKSRRASSKVTPAPRSAPPRPGGRRAGHRGASAVPRATWRRPPAALRARARGRCHPRPGRVGELGIPDVEVPCEHDDVTGARCAVGERRSARSFLARHLGCAKSFDAWRFATTTPDVPAIRTAWTSRRSSGPAVRSCPSPVAAWRGATRIVFAWPARPRRKNPWCAQVTHFENGPGQSGGRVTASKRFIPDQSSIQGTPRRAPPGGTRHPARLRSRARPCSGDSRCRRGGWALPWNTFQVRTRSSIVRAPRLRVPSSACADARRPRRSTRLHAPVRPRARGRPRPLWSRGGARHVAVSLRRAPAPDGYALDEAFYPRSSRIGRSKLRIATKVLEHPREMRRLLARPADVLHLQWLAAPSSTSSCSVPHTARLHGARPAPAPHGASQRLWRRLFERFDRIVVHSERGRDALVDLACPTAGCG